MPFTPTAIQDAYRKLPYPVRSFVASPELNDVVEQIGAKYGLHVDTLGLLSSALTEMLVGLTNPMQFSQQLKSAGVPEAQVALIVNDLNEQVFKPLQEKFREENTEDEEIAREKAERMAVANSAPIPQTTYPASNNNPSTQPAPTEPPYIPSVSKPVSAPTPSYYVPPQEIPTPVAEPAQPTMRTMAHDVESMQNGGVPEPMPYSIPNTPARTPSIPVPTPTPVSVTAPHAVSFPPQTPRPEPQQVFIPTPTPVTASMASSPAIPLVPKTPTPTRAQVTSTLQKYGIDPYREAME